MVGRSPPVDVDCSGDDSDDGPEPEERDPKLEKIKDMNDTELDDNIEKYEGYVQKNNAPGGIVLPDDGVKIKKHLQDLMNEKELRRTKRSQMAVSTPKTLDIEILSRDPGTFGDSQKRNGTRATKQPDSYRGFGTCSTAKTERVSTEGSLDSPSGSEPLDDYKPASCNNGKSIVLSEIISQSPSPERRVPSVERTNRVASGQQAGPSSREVSTTNEHDQFLSCTSCKKSYHLLHTVLGKVGLFCSGCRRKAKALDPSFLDNELKTPDAKVTSKSRKRARQADIIGGTPDTAMEIDSSDEDEKAQGGGTALKSSCNEMPRRLGLRSTYKRRLEGYRIAYPSRSDPEAVEILPADLERLNPMEFLNDTIIDFYIKYIQRPEFLDSDGKERFHFFNSFFYKKLSEVVSAQKKKGGADFSKLRKWTKGTNIFEKEYLFVPIHDKLHWSLAIISFPGHDKGGNSERCIIHLDSMTHGHDSQRVFRLLKSYLVAEWKHSVEDEADDCTPTIPNLKADSIPCKKVPVPLQENESDCGLFLLHYIRKFVECAPRSLNLSELEGDWDVLGVFGRDWFLATEASSLRTSIQEQLHRLFDQEINEQNQAALQGQQQVMIPDGAVCEVVIPLDGEPPCK